MVRRAALPVVLSLSLWASSARAEQGPATTDAVHLFGIAGFSTFVDIMGAVTGIYMERTQATVEPLGPGLLVLWDASRHGRPSRLAYGLRAQGFFGSAGFGGELILSTGVTLARRRHLEVFLLPGVGVSYFSRATGIPAWTGITSGPLFSLGLALAIPTYHGLELFLFAALDLLPMQPYPFLPIGLDGVLGIDLGYCIGDIPPRARRARRRREPIS